MEMRGGNVFVGYHEWAWSLRTSGFPVFAITQSGVVKIGVTCKKPAIYKLPEGTIAIIRQYVSNLGNETWYIYTIPELHEFRVGDKNDWDTSELPSGIKEIVTNMIQQHLADDP